MERGTAGRRPTSPLLKFDLTVQQRFGVSVGRLVFAVTCCYHQADDCNHNHKHLIVAHEHHLPISTFEESGGNPYRFATDSTKLTSLTMLTNPPYSPSPPSLQNADNLQAEAPKQCVLVRVVRDVQDVSVVGVSQKNLMRPDAP